MSCLDVALIIMFWPQYKLMHVQSRVVQLAGGERSYHVFYQLCAGASPDLRGETSFLI